MSSMVTAMTKRRELNPEERADATRLKACFEKLQEDRRASGLPDSQEAIASEYDWTQSTISSYLNARIPLNMDAAIIFAEMLRQPVSSFSPRLADKVARVQVNFETPASVTVPARDRRVPVMTEGQIIATYGNAAHKEMPMADASAPRAFVYTDANVSDQSLEATVSDDSLAPDYNAGTRFIIDTKVKPFPGALVLAINSQGRTAIRKYRELKAATATQPAAYELLATNPFYPPISSGDVDLVLVGVAVESRSSLLSAMGR